MPPHQIVITGTSRGRPIVMGASGGVVSVKMPIGSRSIAVRTQFWPSGLPTPWGTGSSGFLNLNLLDLLRCTTRYFFIESWLAGQSDGWVLGLPVVEYLAQTSDLRWNRRNSNVARWLSEMAGVGLSCYVMELCGAANIALGNGGTSGPDYSCRLAINGKSTQTWFEAKGSSTTAGVTSQMHRAAQQVAPYKRAGSLGIICASCVPVIGSPDSPCINLADPPGEDGLATDQFQKDIASLAATIGWAGEPEAAHELASTVLSFEDGVPNYLAPEQALEEVRRRGQEIASILYGLAEQQNERPVLTAVEGSLSVVLPRLNLQRLADTFREGVSAISEFRINPTRADRETSRNVSVAPDGSAVVWRPDETRERR